MRRFLITVIAAASSVCVASAQTPGIRARLDSAAKAALASSHAPGMAVMIVHRNDTLLASGYGVSDLETGKLVTTSSVFQVGSITKEFTAAAVLELVADGRLKLSDSIGSLLPPYNGPGRTASIHQLLSHTSGIPNLTELPAFRSRAATIRSALDAQSLFENEPLAFTPGTRWAYSNSGYILLGRLIERYGNAPWSDQIMSRIIKPLALNGTRVCTPAIPPGVAGYDREDGQLDRTAPVDPAIPFSAGALCSTAADLTRWVRSLASGRVVTPELYRTMTNPVTLTGGQHAAYGYGIEITNLEAHRRLGHGGAIAGYDSYASYYPDDDLSVVVLMNLAGANAEGVEKSLARIALGMKDARVAERALTSDDAKQFTGQYRAGGGTLNVTYTGTRLHVQGPVDADLARIDDNVFVLADEPDVRLVFTVTDGAAASITWTSRGRTLSLPRIR